MQVGLLLYSRLGKTAGNSILFPLVLPALLLSDGDLAAKPKVTIVAMLLISQNPRTSDHQTSRPNLKTEPQIRGPTLKSGTRKKKKEREVETMRNLLYNVYYKPQKSGIN